MNEPQNPAAVAQRQLDACNARDLDALMAAYADAAELFEHPNAEVHDANSFVH